MKILRICAIGVKNNIFLRIGEGRWLLGDESLNTG